uniref:Uncharacterized protein n=1 Tax=Avena sativa TaxID=4498 RepID=A0ACD5UXT2_AVESA
MRFCQQCSRFQPLKEFDETKRSCRKRLDGHNRRRRKPQPDTMNWARFMTSQQGGTRLSSFPAARPEQNWPGIMGTENLHYTHQLLGISNRPHFVGSGSTNGREGWHFPFQQEGGMNFATGVALETCVYQPLLETVAPLESSSSNSSRMFSDGMLTPPVLHSDCALSLLSAPAHLSGIDASQMVQQTQHIPIVQPLFSNMQLSSSSSWFSRSHASTGTVPATGYSCSVVVNEQLTPALRSDNNDMNHNGIYHFGLEGSSDSAPPSPPFPWY